jgi:hypothetical protein
VNTNRHHIPIGAPLVALALACTVAAAPSASASHNGFLPRSSLQALSKLHARLDNRLP